MSNQSAMLLQPNVEKVYIRTPGHVEQRATYLQLDDRCSPEAMEYAISRGATFLQGVRDHCRQPKKSQCVIVTANNEELGLAAISHLAEYDRRFQTWDSQYYGNDTYVDHGDGQIEFRFEPPEFDDDENLEEINAFFDHIGESPIEITWEHDLDKVLHAYQQEPLRAGNIIEEWEEDERRIPIISKVELLESFGDTESRYIFGDTVAAGARRNLREEPYWKSHNEEPVCLVWEDMGSLLCGGTALESLMCAIDFFAGNKRIYILRLRRDVKAGHPELMRFQNNELEDMDNEWSKLILNYLIDTIDGTIPKAAMKPYLSAILEEAARERNISLAEIDTETIVDSVFELREDKKCFYICKMLDYTTRGWTGNHDRVLRKEDVEPMLSHFFKRKAGGNPKKELQALVGMDEVKHQIQTLINGLKFQKQRQARGLASVGYHNVHLMIGAPGTAKTTVAKILGQRMVEEGLLPGDRFLSVNGAELKGEFVGQSAPKTRELIENHDIIFIDEAYSLTADNIGRGGIDSYSQEVLAQLAVELENHATDKLFIFAGYGGRKVTKENDKMKQFVDANPGIKSRINTTFYFDSYDQDQMADIFASIAAGSDYTLDEDVRPLVREYFAGRMKDPNFGNGREARSLFENAVKFAGSRIMSAQDPDSEDLSRLTGEDAAAAIAQASDGNELQNVHADRTIQFAF